MTNPNPRAAKGREELRKLICAFPANPCCSDAEVSEGTKGYIECDPCGAQLRAIPAALDEIERLRGGLEKYGRHIGDCSRLNCRMNPCDCGFDAVLSEDSTP